MEKIEILGIKTNSWHYRYYENLKKCWGLEKTSREGSICKYSRFVGIFSLLTLMALPLIIVGWLMLKFSRFAYKIMDKLPITTRVIDYLDRKINYGSFLEARVDDMETSPLLNCSLFGLLWIFILVVLVMLLVIGSLGICGFISVLPKIPIVIAVSILLIGWAFFQIFAVFGYALKLLIIGLCIGLKYVAIYIPTGSWLIAKILLVIVILAALSLPIVYLIHKFFTSPKTYKIRQWFLFKFNGFQEARVKAEARAVVKKAERRKREYDNYGKPSLMDKFKDWFRRAIGSFFSEKSVNATIRGKEVGVKVMGGLSLLKNTLTAMYHGVCPMIEFIDEDDITEDTDVPDNS
ncbi:hypothetical protein LCGC14_1468220 [marine sediment metagenome]|uniref:Uncharacterized protein n=1 Tax=marine sediment metagenome TaxID=412755 RepID=A0A0F9JZ17_9ZZZZ